MKHKTIAIIFILILFISGCATVPKSEVTPVTETTRAKDMVCIPPYEGRYAMRTVVIDPGHGGKDPGARSPIGIEEKNLVLSVCKKLKEYLQSQGIIVILTRDSDKFISLWKRANIANRERCDFFISIHANMARQKQVDGVEVFYLSEAVDNFARATAAAENAALSFENSSFNISAPKTAIATTLGDMLCTENRAESIELASYISNSLAEALGARNRGVKAARFYVLKGAQMPSVLVEIGFLSNKKEAMQLRDEEYQQKLARAMADGVLLYKNRYEKTDGFTRAPVPQDGTVRDFAR